MASSGKPSVLQSTPRRRLMGGVIPSHTSGMLRHPKENVETLGWPWEAQSSPRVARESWGWRSSLRVPWTARRSNRSILKEISPGISLEGMMLKLKLQYFGPRALLCAWLTLGSEAGSGLGEPRPALPSF